MLAFLVVLLLPVLVGWQSNGGTVVSRTTVCSPTRLAFGVLTYLIDNRIVFCGGGGSPHAEPGSPDDPNLVPQMKTPKKNDPEIASKSSQNDPKMFPKLF